MALLNLNHWSTGNMSPMMDLVRPMYNHDKAKAFSIITYILGE